MENKPAFFTRLSLAFRIFFRALADADFALAVEGGLKGEPAPTVRPAPTQSEPRAFKEAPPDAALQLLGLLQQEGRFIDFLEEEVTSFSDAEVGAAARLVHEGCRKAVRDHFKIVPVRTEDEGSKVILSEGFNPTSVRVTGNVVGKPPFTGSLVHRGWRVAEVKLPKVADGHDTRILAAAEVEL